MKETYEAPEIEVVYFEKEDIITASGDNDFDIGDSGWDVAYMLGLWE